MCGGGEVVHTMHTGVHVKKKKVCQICEYRYTGTFMEQIYFYVVRSTIDYRSYMYVEERVFVFIK